jgi:hypothetical protein
MNGRFLYLDADVRHPTPKAQAVAPLGSKHPGNRQFCDKRGRPDAGERLGGNLANPKLATFCAAIWLTFSLLLTLREAQILSEKWRRHDDAVRQHNALGYRPPVPESIIQIDHRPPMH